MFTTLKEAFKSKEIRTKILIILGLLVLFRVGCWLPVPGINVNVFSDQINSQSFLSLLSGITGGALANGAFLALGVSPYITAQIVVQLLSMAIPSWGRLASQGEEGRKKISKYTKIFTLVLAAAQAIGIVVAFAKSGALDSSVFFNVEWLTAAVVVLALVAGSMFTLWLGEKITEQGIVNGLSLLIFVGILSTAGLAISSSITNAVNGDLNSLWGIIAFIVALILIFAMIVFMDKAERRVPINYDKQTRGRRTYAGGKSFLPIRLMGTGVLPIIFAMSLLSFPQIIFSIFGPDSPAAQWYNTYMGAGSWAYSVLIGFLILGFAFFTNTMNFKAGEIAQQIQDRGGYIMGFRQGRTTAEYLNKINKRIVFFGACFLAFLTIVPTLVFKAIGDTGLVSAFSATGMIIVVSCALEINKGLSDQLLVRQHKGFLK